MRQVSGVVMVNVNLVAVVGVVTVDHVVSLALQRAIPVLVVDQGVDQLEYLFTVAH